LCNGVQPGRVKFGESRRAVTSLTVVSLI